MAAAYKSLLSAVPVDMIAEIRESQRGWIRSREVACPATPYYPSAPDIATCLQDYENQRTQTLQHMIEHRDALTFVWNSVSLTASASTPPADESRPDGPGTLNASWPQAASATPDWIAWNKAIESAARTIASAGQAKPDGRWHAGWVTDEDVRVTTSIGLVTRGLVTAEIVNDWYGHGAAHPNEDSIQFNWLLKERRELRPEDVFKSDSGWDKALQSKTDKYLHQTLDADVNGDYQSFMQPGEMAKTLHGIVIEPSNWQLDREGLTIIFQKYAVACYACTPPPFTIPWTDLKPWLRPDFSIR